MALYNKDLKRVITITDCATCPQFDRKLKKCNGIDKLCFEYDEKTKTCIDGVTHLPIKFD